MKALKLIIAGMMIFIAGALPAQVSVNFTMGVPPPWGPVGYTGVHYYYLPDVEAYYDVRSSMFIYFGGGEWIHRSYLPARYKNYDLYGGYKVVMPDYHGNAPYSHFKEHKSKYAKGYHGKPQRTIGERPGNRNPGDKNSHDGNHGGNSGNHDNGKSNGYSHDKGDSHSSDKNSKGDHGHDGGNGKKK